MSCFKFRLLLILATAGVMAWEVHAGIVLASPADAAKGGTISSDIVMPLYKPREDGSPRARMGGQSRSGDRGGDPQLIALVPDHVAFTVTGNPSLCWYISKRTALPITITLVDSRGIRPILEESIPSPTRPGIHCIKPRHYGVELKEQEAYRWFVTLVVDPERPSRDVVAGGVVERVSFDEACALDMPCTETVCNRDAIYRYSESGLWYDSISCILDLMERGEDKNALQQILDHLLHQTGVNLPS